MLSVVMLSDVMLSDVMLSDVMLNVFMLGVVAPNQGFESNLSLAQLKIEERKEKKFLFR